MKQAKRLPHNGYCAVVRFVDRREADRVFGSFPSPAKAMQEVITSYALQLPRLGREMQQTGTLRPILGREYLAAPSNQADPEVYSVTINTLELIRKPSGF